MNQAHYKTSCANYEFQLSVAYYMNNTGTEFTHCTNNSIVCQPKLFTWNNQSIRHIIRRNVSVTHTIYIFVFNFPLKLAHIRVLQVIYCNTIFKNDIFDLGKIYIFFFFLVLTRNKRKYTYFRRVIPSGSQ